MIGSFGFVMVLANLLNTMGSLGTAMPCDHIIIEAVVDVVHADTNHLVGLDDWRQNSHRASGQHVCSSCGGTDKTGCVSGDYVVNQGLERDVNTKLTLSL